MTVIELKAAEVRKRLEPVEEGFAFDPALILMISQIVVEVIKAIQACQKAAAEVAGLARSPGLLGRWRLRRIVREHIADDEMYRHVGPAVTRAVLEVGESVTAEEAERMYAEAA